MPPTKASEGPAPPPPSDNPAELAQAAGRHKVRGCLPTTLEALIQLYFGGQGEAPQTPPLLSWRGQLGATMCVRGVYKPFT